jgi:hypothetical protein
MTDDEVSSGWELRCLNKTNWFLNKVARLHNVRLFSHNLSEGGHYYNAGPEKPFFPIPGPGVSRAFYCLTSVKHIKHGLFLLFI